MNVNENKFPRKHIEVHVELHPIENNKVGVYIDNEPLYMIRNRRLIVLKRWMNRCNIYHIEVYCLKT